MTPNEFLQAHLFGISGVNTQDKVNLHITPERGTQTDTYTIIGCTIPVKSTDTITTTQVINILSQLEKITFTLQNNSASEQLLLQVTDKSEHFGEDIHSFFYYTVQPVVIPSSILNINVQETGEPIDDSITELQDIYEDVSISFEPFITDLQFAFSEFNATISNAINNRTSNRIVESDRNTSSIIPSNFDAIISGSATNAEVQDSLYQVPGWINARYKGTKTTTRDYGDTPPTITGTLFKGEQYTLNTSGSSIFEAPYDSRVLQQLFYSGEEKLPQVQFETYKFENGPSEVIATTNLQNTINSLTSEIEITLTYEDSNIKIIKPGDVIAIGDIPATNPDSTTPFIVTQVQGNTVSIVGGYKEYSNNIEIGEIGPSDIRVFDKSNRIYKFIEQSSKVEGVSNSKIWIQEDNVVVATNEAGTIVYIQKP